MTILSQKENIDSLLQENSQLKQMISSATTLDKVSTDTQPEYRKAGRHKNEITADRFRDALKEQFKTQVGNIISWIKKKIVQLNKDPNYCSTLRGNRRQMAPLYVAIAEGVFTPKNSNDARPIMEGSPLERFFGLPAGSYNDYSLPNKYRPGDIQEITESFEKDVLNNAS